MEMNKFDACTFTILHEKTFFLAVSKLSRDAMHDVLNMVFAIYDAEREGFRSLNVLIFKVLLLKVMSKRFNENDGALHMSHLRNHILRNILVNNDLLKIEPP